MRCRLDQIGISARAAVSALGWGAGPHVDAMRQMRSGLRACDLDTVDLPCFIGRVDGIEELAFPPAQAAFDNRATRLVMAAACEDGFRDHVDRAVARWGASRVGLVIGTSTSGVERLEQVYRDRDADAPLAESYTIRHHNDHHAVTAFLEEYLGVAGPVFTVSTACSSSAKSLVDAAQLIQLGICDAVVSGGVDSLCMTSLYGFEALELVSRQPCRPADADRDGLSIGEAAGLLLLERGSEGPFLSGYGESSDAVNMSTPPPDGAGAATAMSAALLRAALTPQDVSFVKLHGTATPINDQAETTAVAAVVPGTAATSLKGLVGHTLGAAGALETVMCLDAMEAGIVPGTAGLQSKDPAIAIEIPTATVETPVHHVVCNAFGFGGSNCALVLSAQ
ncbi:MAG: beta-ketoacyl-ACP synthase [Pseudomonadota bacterium]